MKFLVSCLLLAAAPCWTSPLNVEDVAVFLPLLGGAVHPRPCPPNEMWQQCTGLCSDCDRRRSCVVTECQSGCDCVPYFFRVEPGGPCLPVARCPRPECGSNEVFRECGPVCEKCGTMRCRMMSCEYRCYCKEGHLRNADGACVPEDQCPKRSTCSHNEEWSESGPEDEYCLHEEGQEVSNRTQEVAGCYCKDGHKRNTFGSCVRISFCPGGCYGVSEYRACVPKCGTTCQSDPTCEEDGDCHAGCFCPATHRMNEFNQCIPKEQCTTDIPDVKIVRGSGIMVEESTESETTPPVERTTLGNTAPPETVDPGQKSQTDDPGQKSQTDDPGLPTEDVGPTEAQTDATTTEIANENV